MNHHLVVDIPFSSEATISSRSKKYVTCLQMVHSVLCKEIDNNISIDLFNRLGIVAGFIDEHLDDLNLNEQRRLLQEYDSLFDTIWKLDHYLIFRNEICQFVEQQNFVFSCQAIHLKDLFLFVQLAKSEGLKPEIKSFGKTIIQIAIEKQNATQSKELIQLLKAEGVAVVSLLRALLSREYGDRTTFEPTLQLLQELEHILNVADDTLDTASDKRKNLISKSLGPFHRFTMLKHVVFLVVKTVKKQPLKIGYYGPRLTWYYFSKTLR